MDTYNYICVHFYKIWTHTIILVYIFFCIYSLKVRNMSKYTSINTKVYLQLYE